MTLTARLTAALTPQVLNAADRAYEEMWWNDRDGAYAAARAVLIAALLPVVEELSVLTEIRAENAAFMTALQAEGPTPAPGDGTRCSMCSAPYQFDTTVPSVIWNRVIRAQNLPEFLCCTCIVKEFAKAGVTFTAELWGDAFNGLPIEVVVDGAESTAIHELSLENTHLRARLNERP
jgi:hypothetical protein